MNILLVNDDGIQSPLLALLCRACADRGHTVTVSAPATQQSAKSHSFTLSVPLVAHQRQMDGADAAWAVEGSPVDACRIGMLCLCGQKPDLVISGINAGWNAGLSVYVSGTVGAAREAAFQGIPALAVSIEPGTPEESIRRFADYAVRTGEKLVDYPVPPLTLCSINLPKCAPEEVVGTAMCPISRSVYRDGYERRVSPRGDVYFWLKPYASDEEPTEGSDQALLRRGWLTVTFLGPDGCRQDDYADFPLPW